MTKTTLYETTRSACGGRRPACSPSTQRRTRANRAKLTAAWLSLSLSLTLSHFLFLSLPFPLKAARPPSPATAQSAMFITVSMSNLSFVVFQQAARQTQPRNLSHKTQRNSIIRTGHGDALTRDVVNTSNCTFTWPTHSSNWPAHHQHEPNCTNCMKSFFFSASTSTITRHFSQILVGHAQNIVILPRHVEQT